ncbi:circadian clock protein KaiC [Desulfatitalea alkaliphila]|uniref:non-specific serine/threonine protein kinase n=1 Tax=Desulfatitalea alkaliphila TaxID=2929485 RepID=A0AA41QZ49_9BACT|nr:circadian clock protein KaiC [Desulfatitalea alkaliphila]MCJ8499009.1 circadian clock protein KaiC [Desulfatitalea alkaliphila]
MNDFSSGNGIIQAIPKLKTGNTNLDAVLQGGFPKNRLSLISGGAGTGKTLLTLECVYRKALTGESAVFVTFEENAAVLRENAAALGWNLADLEASGRFFIQAVDTPITVIRSGEFDVQGLLAMLDRRLKTVGATWLAIDAIDMLLRIFDQDVLEREQLGLLCNWLGKREVTTLLTVKAMTSGEKVYPYLDFMADCVLHLDQRMDGEVRTRRLRVNKYRGSGFLSNEYPYVIDSRGVRLVPVSCMALNHVALRDRMSSGIQNLDRLLGGGFFKGSTILFSGPSGVGKTLLASTYARAACRQGERVLYISFEESADSLISGGRNAGLELQSLVEKQLLHIMPIMPESMGTEQHLFHILDAIERYSVEHVVLDAISACRRMGAPKAAFDLLLRLVNHCKTQGIACVFTNQALSTGGHHEISGVGLSSLLDTALVMRYVKARDELQRRLLVFKSRGSAHSNRYHELRITDEGIVISDPRPDTAGDHGSNPVKPTEA